MSQIGIVAWGNKNGVQKFFNTPNLDNHKDLIDKALTDIRQSIKFESVHSTFYSFQIAQNQRIYTVYNPINDSFGRPGFLALSIFIPTSMVPTSNVSKLLENLRAVYLKEYYDPRGGKIKDDFVREDVSLFIAKTRNFNTEPSKPLYNQNSFNKKWAVSYYTSLTSIDSFFKQEALQSDFFRYEKVFFIDKAIASDGHVGINDEFKIDTQSYTLRIEVKIGDTDKQLSEKDITSSSITPNFIGGNILIFENLKSYDDPKITIKVEGFKEKRYSSFSLDKSKAQDGIVTAVLTLSEKEKQVEFVITNPKKKDHYTIRITDTSKETIVREFVDGKYNYSFKERSLPLTYIAEDAKGNDSSGVIDKNTFSFGQDTKQVYVTIKDKTPPPPPPKPKKENAVTSTTTNSKTNGSQRIDVNQFDNQSTSNYTSFDDDEDNKPKLKLLQPKYIAIAITAILLSIVVIWIIPKDNETTGLDNDVNNQIAFYQGILVGEKNIKDPNEKLKNLNDLYNKVMFYKDSTITDTRFNSLSDSIQEKYKDLIKDISSAKKTAEKQIRFRPNSDDDKDIETFYSKVGLDKSLINITKYDKESESFYSQGDQLFAKKSNKAKNINGYVIAQEKSNLLQAFYKALNKGEAYKDPTFLTSKKSNIIFFYNYSNNKWKQLWSFNFKSDNEIELIRGKDHSSGKIVIEGTFTIDQNGQYSYKAKTEETKDTKENNDEKVTPKPKPKEPTKKDVADELIKESKKALTSNEDQIDPLLDKLDDFKGQTKVQKAITSLEYYGKTLDDLYKIKKEYQGKVDGKGKIFTRRKNKEYTEKLNKIKESINKNPFSPLSKEQIDYINDYKL